MDSQPFRIAFAGTPEFAAVALEALLAAGVNVAVVLTQPDRPAGRGMALQASAVKRLAQAHGIEVLQPRSLKLNGKYPEDAESTRARLADIAVDAWVVAAYGLILPACVLARPPLGCINIHASLLPRWRGAAPIHRAIEAGDAQTGISIMQMDEGLDTGDVLAVEAVPIGPQDTTASLHDTLAALGGRMIVRTLEYAVAGKLRRTPQLSLGLERVTYAEKVQKAESPVNWQRSAAEISRQIRAFNPAPGAHTLWQGGALKLWDCYENNSFPRTIHGDFGQFFIENANLNVRCGDGSVLTLTEVQRAGGKRMAAADWWRGVQGEQPELLAQPERCRFGESA